MIRLLYAHIILLFVMSNAHASQLCDHVQHIPNNDVTYRHSPNVVPADLNAVALDIADVNIPLTAYLVEELGLNIPVSASNLGDITIKKSGQVIFNGQNISKQVHGLCNVPKKPNVKQINEKTNGQEYKQPRQAPLEAVQSDKSETSLNATNVKQDEEPIYGGFGQDNINARYND